MTDPALAGRETLASSIVEDLANLPGIARLAPSFREALTAATKEFFGSEDAEATVVDIVAQGSEVLIFIDMYTDGSRAAGDIVDDVYDRVHRLLTAEQRDSTTLKMRILGITRDH
ncbi:hypothetical protein I2485_14565 [Nesterenkonia sp. E16_7]|uniref:hypothetical protein n=1 Tax=unclassified Nesterenkonia TaxID=2629769 RepID=UPI001A92F06C|nr:MULTISPECIES: hypothetical protein [unclassified Nesterenkonia]MBO0596981.1 hypothetical protein [Nesterenkonia sp. E16_10]MBO0599870.1 hypothetical protein [Nesterenkonia sp. E16_7]